MIRVVSVDEAEKILSNVIQQDYDKSISKQLGLALSPNWDGYRLIERLDMLRIFVAEHEEKPIGYACVTFFPSNHYSVLCATVDALWVLEEYRTKTSVGVTLIKEIEKEAKSREAELINFHSQDFNNLSCILDRFGYFQTDVTMSKRFTYGS